MGRSVAIEAPTLQEVAKLAGCSPSTVGLVLNGRGDSLRIRQATQQRIREAADKLHYAPNTLARGLSGKSTRSLGILWSLCGPHDFGSTVQRMVQHARLRGYTAHIAESLSEPDTMKATLWEFYRRRVDGVIIQMPFISAEEERAFFEQDASFLKMMRKFRAVCLVSQHDMSYPFDAAHQSFNTAYQDAVAHLTTHGRKTLAMLTQTGEQDVKYHALRRAVHALRAAGHDLDLQLVHLHTDGHDSAFPPQDIQKLETLLPGVDAALCHNDNIAAMLMQWLAHRGVRVPQDVAVVGFNDQFMARCMTPPMASIARHDDTLVDQALALFWRRLDTQADAPPPPQRRVVEMQFMPRPSAGQP